MSALLILEQLQRPGFVVVLFSVDTPQWRVILHFVFLSSACVAAGTIAHQLTRAPRRLERAAGWVLVTLLTLCGIAIGLLFLLLIAVASVRQYVTITADDGTQFLIRAKSWHHTDYTVLEPAEEWGPWYADGASIVTDDPNTALAVGEYVLQRTPSGYRLTFGSGPGDGRSYELEWSPVDAELMPPEADERHLCGQVSALEGIRFRSDWEHDQGLIDDVEYESRVAAIEDGWKYMVIGGTDVSPAIKDAQRALSTGGIGYENTEFQRAVGDVGLACDEAGSLVAVSALPGQGG